MGKRHQYHNISWDSTLHWRASSSSNSKAFLLTRLRSCDNPAPQGAGAACEDETGFFFILHSPTRFLCWSRGPVERWTLPRGQWRGPGGLWVWQKFYDHIYSIVHVYMNVCNFHFCISISFGYNMHFFTIKTILKWSYLKKAGVPTILDARGGDDQGESTFTVLIHRLTFIGATLFHRKERS